MENQRQLDIMSDHEMIVDDENGQGVIFREKKELKRVTSESLECGTVEKDDQTLIHTRSIGTKEYIVKKVANQDDDCGAKEIMETNMTEEEVEAFHSEWNKKWNPSIVCQQSGGIKGFFKSLLRLE